MSGNKKTVWVLSVDHGEFDHVIANAKNYLKDDHQQHHTRRGNNSYRSHRVAATGGQQQYKQTLFQVLNTILVTIDRFCGDTWISQIRLSFETTQKEKVWSANLQRKWWLYCY